MAISWTFNPFAGTLDAVSVETGDVVGPGSSTDHAVVRFDGVTGKLLQNSVAILSDAGALTALTQLVVDQLTLDGTTIESSSSQTWKSTSQFRHEVAADTDIVMLFVGTTNSGQFNWEEDENRFRFFDSVMFNENAYFASEVANTSSGGTATITWKEGNDQKLTLSENVTLTFTAPDGPCTMKLRIIQDSTARTITWPTIKWVGKALPTLSTGSGDEDIAAFYYNGTDWYGMMSNDFGVPP